ncbi:MAG: NAD(P)H-dependent oxidoreductase subunit E [Desulfobulbaceae bacterium]|nr:NAD(P)H-dependent oxidoreductase subunit E [Desulfobulbaceae bacterium]
MEESAIEKLEVIYDRYVETEGSVISVLQDIQSEFRYIPEDTVYWFSEKSGVPASKFYGVITFYGQFHTKPRGENIIATCCGAVCHVKGSERIFLKLREELSLRGGQDMTADGRFTVEQVSCQGACNVAPVVVVNDKIYGKMSPNKIVKQVKKM